MSHRNGQVSDQLNGQSFIYTLGGLKAYLVEATQCPAEVVGRRLKDLKCLAHGGSFRHNLKTRVCPVVFGNQVGFIHPDSEKRLARKFRIQPENIHHVPLSDPRLVSFYRQLIDAPSPNGEDRRRGSKKGERYRRRRLQLV